MKKKTTMGIISTHTYNSAPTSEINEKGLIANIRSMALVNTEDDGLLAIGVLRTTDSEDNGETVDKVVKFILPLTALLDTAKHLAAAGMAFNLSELIGDDGIENASDVLLGDLEKEK